ncbi:MAG: flippase [Thermodesulfovibrionales bacterium]
MSRELNSTLKTVVKGTSLILFGMVAGHLLWFAIKVLIVRSMTVEEFGLYSLSITVASVITAVSLLGVPEGTARNISTLRGQDRQGEVMPLARASFQISLVSGVAASVALFALAGPVASHVFYKPAMAAPLRVVAAAVLVDALSQSFGGVLRGHGIVRHRVFYQDMGRPLFFLAFLGAVLLRGYSFMGVMYAFTLAAALVFVFISGYEYRKQGMPPLSLRRGSHYGELLRFSLPLLVASLSELVMIWTDTLMLGRYTPPESVGIYNAGMSLARLLTFALGAMGFVFLPLATELHARGQAEEIRKDYQVLTKWVFAATFPLFFILFFFPETTITFLFGDRLLESSAPLRVLALAFLFHVFLGTNGVLLMAMGMTGTLMRISILGAAVNVALNYVLIKRVGMGVMGASLATLVSYAAINVVVSAALYRASGVHPFTAKYLKPLAGASAIGLVLYALAKTVAFSLWLMPLYLVLFVGGYALSLLLSGSLDGDDMALFEAISLRTGMRMEPIRKLLQRFARE